MDFLVHMEVNLVGAGKDANRLLQEEAARAKELAGMGILRRLWRVPGRRENWGIWTADSMDELHAALSSLPLYPFLHITVHPLATHANDPNLPLL